MYEAVAHEPVIPTGRGRLIVRRFLRNKPAVAGVLVLALIFVYAFGLGPFAGTLAPGREPVQAARCRGRAEAGRP